MLLQQMNQSPVSASNSQELVKNENHVSKEEHEVRLQPKTDMPLGQHFPLDYFNEVERKPNSAGPSQSPARPGSWTRGAPGMTQWNTGLLRTGWRKGTRTIRKEVKVQGSIGVAVVDLSLS